MRRMGLLLLVLFCFFCYEQLGLQTTRTAVESQRLPAEFDGFRIVQLSDLHGRTFGGAQGLLLDRVEALAPDLIAVTGDFFGEDVSGGLALLGALTALAPTVFVTGNHEWSLPDVHGTLAAAEALGVLVLENEGFLLKKDGAQILVGGVDDPCGPFDMISPEAFGAACRAQYGDLFFLLLGHRNETPAYWSSTTADLVLAGHAHGGLIRLPLLGGLIRREGQRGYDSGLYQENGTQVYVSRGLGGQTLRLFNRPELALLILRQS